MLEISNPDNSKIYICLGIELVNKFLEDTVVVSVTCKKKKFFIFIINLLYRVVCLIILILLNFSDSQISVHCMIFWMRTSLVDLCFMF